MIARLITVIVTVALLILVSWSCYRAGGNARDIYWQSRMEDVRQSNERAVSELRNKYYAVAKSYQNYLNESAVKIHDLETELKSKPIVQCKPDGGGRVRAVVDPRVGRVLLEAACDPKLPRKTGTTACVEFAGNTDNHP